ncbi:MAG TPA: hypothetical protein VF187_01040, partial [Gemmatimonadales bacterium]
NVEKSDPMGGMGGGGGGGGGGMGGMMRDAVTTITQTATELTLVTKFGENTRTLTYKLDGSESVNQGMRGGETKSKAHWDGATLIIESVSNMSGPNGDMQITSKEVRSLSEDGKLMTVVTTTTTPNGERVRKTVYDKQ